MDYNAILTPYSKDKIINVVIEIPKGSSHKIEFDRSRKIMVLDRVEPAIFAKPVNYGFIPATLDDDGDELDVLFVTDEPMTTGVVSEATVICVPADDRNTGNRIQSLDDLGEQWKKQIDHHFSRYKDLKKPGSTKVLGFGDATRAHEVISECIERWNKQ